MIACFLDLISKLLLIAYQKNYLLEHPEGISYDFMLFSNGWVVAQKVEMLPKPLRVGGL